MRCTACGAEAQHEAMYCTKCGTCLAQPKSPLGEPEDDRLRLVLRLTPRQVLISGLSASLILVAAALAATWVPALHLGPGIDALSVMAAWLASLLAVVVQVGASATAIGMLGKSTVRRSETEGRLVDREAPQSSLPASWASVVEHTTFRLRVPEALPRGRTTADQG